MTQKRPLYTLAVSTHIGQHSTMAACFFLLPSVARRHPKYPSNEVCGYSTLEYLLLSIAFSQPSLAYMGQCATIVAGFMALTFNG